MTLARYYYHESEYHLKSIGKLVHLNKFTGDIVWGPLDELGNDIDLIDEINRLPRLRHRWHSLKSIDKEVTSI